jgi:hypothetical protein
MRDEDYESPPYVSLKMIRKDMGMAIFLLGGTVQGER